MVRGAETRRFRPQLQLRLRVLCQLKQGFVQIFVTSRWHAATVILPAVFILQVFLHGRLLLRHLLVRENMLLLH